MVLQRSPSDNKDQAMKALQECEGDVDKAVAMLNAAAAENLRSRETSSSPAEQ